MKIAFENMGRHKMNWQTDVPSLSDEALTREIRSQAALRSQGIEFDWNEDGSEAQIIVGGCRAVGIVRVLNGGLKLGSIVIE